MKKKAKDGWIDFLQAASVFKQKLEHEMHTVWKVPYFQMRYYTNVCIKMGMILERIRQRKIKDGKRGKR